MLLSASDLYCGFARRADLGNERFTRVVEHFASIEMGELDRIGGWATHWSRRWEFPVAASAIEHLLSEGESHHPLMIIESGCGTTPLPFWIAAAEGRTVKGVDLDRSCLPDWQQADVPCRHPASATEFVEGDMESLPFDDNVFDLGYSVSALEHTARPDVAMRELCRVVKPGGGIVVTMDVDMCRSHATTSPDVFSRLQEVLWSHAVQAVPVQWILPGEILTFESRTMNPAPRWKRSVKAFLSQAELRATPDFAVFGFIGKKR